MKIIKRLVFTVLLIQLGWCAFGRQTEIYQDPQRTFNDAVDLYERKVYALAQEIFGRILKQSGLVVELQSEAAFYYAASSYFLGNEDALEKLIRFTEIHGASRHLNDAWLFIGNIQFSNKRYKDVMNYYDKVDESQLAPELLPQFYFNKGYVLMSQDQYDASLRYFDKIQKENNGDNKYYERATYYKACIFYQEEKFATALPLFQSLRENKEYGKNIPVYILDIHHRLGDYQTVVNEGEKLYKSAGKDQQSQIASIMSDAYFKIGDYENAKKYLDLQKGRNRRITRTQNYQSGYIKFINKEYNEAIRIFSSITTVNDIITQSAYYHIALAQLQLDKKKEAQRNFYLAYQMDFDLKIKEDALFNYAKLTYNLSYDPYKEAFKALMEYLQKYPDSDRTQEANQYIVNLAVSTKNYPDALAALQQIEKRTPEMQAIEQRLCYMYAVDIFLQRRYNDAIDWFEKAAKMNAINEIAPESTYWIAEAYYRMNKYAEAKTSYQKFASLKNAVSLPYFKQVPYNLGYVAMNQGNYSEAQKEFQKFVNQKGELPNDMVQDAYIRLADSYYIAKSFNKAIEYYAKAIDGNAKNADYAVYQEAISFGAQKKFQEKIDQLNLLTTKYSYSLYHRDAVYEIGITLLLLNKEQEAIAYFDRIIQNYPNSNVALKSLLRKGQLLYNNGKNEEALTILKETVASYPNTSQAREALVIIKNIYLEMNMPDAYFVYAEKIPFANVTADEKESILFDNAEELFLSGNRAKAEEALKTYLDQYPEGAYGNTARFYYADCAMFAQQYDLALQQYEILIQKDQTENGRKAVAITAALYYDKKEYAMALQRYQRALEVAETTEEKTAASINVMRCYEHLDQPRQLQESSFKVLQIKDLPDNVVVEAHLNAARASVALNDEKTAEKEYNVVKNMASGTAVAEASFYLTQALYKKAQYEKSIEAAFDLINDFPNEDFWVVKSFILLADNYAAEGNNFQARQTLNSIIENASIPELKEEAQRKLAVLGDEEE
ncbi:MAG: tetratricopeptide repeat protein [Bacteroidales bacterium]|jgi:TolA-binding protein|nr:tetratricopeptide repeat protein [Bacteroidales bacterium]